MPQTAAVEIYDEIGAWGVSAADFKAALSDIGDVDGIEIAIHSPGGSVLDGWAMYNLLKSNPGACDRQNFEGLWPLLWPQ